MSFSGHMAETPDVDNFAPTSSIQKHAPKVQNASLLALGMTEVEAEQWQALRKKFLHKKPVEWDNVHPPGDHKLVDYHDLNTPPSPHLGKSMEEDFRVSNLPAKEVTALLQKVVVVKLNGGLGTGMGCKGPKSAIEVSHGMSFLDLAVSHIQVLNKKYGVDIPLLLMNSFNTHEETKKIITKYEHSGVSITTFQQSKFPRFYKDTLFPMPKPNTPFNPKDWYPPGSGNVFTSLQTGGLLDKFIKAGKEHMFISNVESLGALVDEYILKYVLEQKIDFAVEVTDRISNDVTGGTLVKYNDQIHLMELSQVPHNRLQQFRANNFKYWNTNNLWVKLDTVSSLLQKNALDLEFVVSSLHDQHGLNEIRLETPAGMAIQSFQNSVAIHVPRTRYRPVKSTNQLMIAQSNLFELMDGRMIMNPRREPATVPVIKLGEEFREVPEYNMRIKSIPDLLELEHLTVSGNVWFGSDIVLKGTIIIVANHGERIDIPDGVILENKIISGNLRILDH